MKRNNWPVGEEGLREMSPENCLYCKAPKGAEHNQGCIIRERTVIMDFKMRVCMSFPEDWTDSQIESRLNESSYCRDNFKPVIERYIEMDGCLCDSSYFEFVREASIEDEKAHGLSVGDLPS